MKPYIALFRIRFTNSIQYRVAAIAGISTQFAWGLMYILAFRAFYAENPNAFPMTLEETVAYVWMQQAFIALFFIWFWENNILESIESGSIAYELTRPMDLYNRWFTMACANRMGRALLRCVPILFIAFILPGVFRLTLPGNIVTLGLFLLSIMLSMSVVAAFGNIIYISGFYLINSNGIRIVVAVLSDFLSGGYIPVPFFPDNMRLAIELSPFGAMQNMPLLIFNGHLQGEAIVRGMGLQVFWLIVLVIVGRLFMAKSLKRIVVQGG